MIVIIFLIAAFASFFAPYDPGKTDVSVKLKAPSSLHLLGTDQLGRDVFSRMLHGSRVSLSVGFVAVAISIFIGILVGAVAGYYSGWVDALLMRFVDIMLCFPSFFLILTVVALLGPNILNIMVVIGITSWMGTSRFVRAEFLSLRERDFTQAAKALGVKDRQDHPPAHPSQCPGSRLCDRHTESGVGDSSGGRPQFPGIRRPAPGSELGKHPHRGQDVHFRRLVVDRLSGVGHSDHGSLVQSCG